MNIEREKYLAYSRYAKSEPDRFHKNEHKKQRRGMARTILSLLVLAGVLLAGFFFVFPYAQQYLSEKGGGSGADRGETVWEEGSETGLTERESEAPAEAETESQIPFAPHAVASTQPENMIAYTEIMKNGEIVTSDQLDPWYEMDFGGADAYTQTDGIVTFRGNHFRDSASYGTAYIASHAIQAVWQKQTGALSYNGTTWSGSGWTGQPLVMHWPRTVKQHMNMYDAAKEDDDLVEVIYPCMDGYVYFLNLVTGSATRDPLYLGFTFKGAGALDPRGYPILYVGAGYDSTQGRARVFAVSLLDGSILYTFGNDDSFSLRGALSYFDSSPLVDAASDTLIYPGENGILYLIRLGTAYDPEEGTLSLNVEDTVKWHYSGLRSSSASYWVGMEDSAAVYRGYLYIADNGGHLMCLDLNTLELIWVQDILDDSNSTPVLSIEDDRVYLYVSTSFRQGWRSSTTATVPIWKIDAQTGEIIWQTEYECYTQDGVSGGVQSTVALGKESLSDRLFVTVSMVGNTYNGVLSCLNKETGEIIWEHTSAYAWSSPVCVYDPAGNGEVIYADASGSIYIVDPDTGERLSSVSISDGVIEASPVVYRNYMVIGTRASKIWGLQLG